ncbi:amino acid-binding ACT domain protein [Desulfofarcimen acetoxidans DSM 771]|uniref:Amino acid-binding ACT domain protein n=1 Tax=Desulfofarcimen acetoxidans (strain ATCC 49208 / DSM 771 / KCTC 5769 / VKM B-1644 / 5575) TaxID=485916 RepID=C8VVU1_DESAS|nr:ACT domain-containing protein [Desulfofarcimen acetoxidans]ACV64228.1 amino acid-binding ACT domain protein [Desulfofarcimen acetoxidans DSM 771]
MKVKQVSVFLENKSGRLARVTQVLGNNNINIRALSIADTTDFGILRLIVNDPDKAFTVLKEDGFTVSVTEVLAVEVRDEPGGLSNILEVLKQAGINIEYLYAFLQKASNAALVVFRVEQIDEAIIALQEKNVNILAGDEVYRL